MQGADHCGPHWQVRSGRALAAQGSTDTPRGCTVLGSRLWIDLIPTQLTNLPFLDPSAGLDSEALGAEALPAVVPVIREVGFPSVSARKASQKAEVQVSRQQASVNCTFK